MHETLLSTSSRVLAQSSVNRLETFSNIDQSHPALVDARRNLVDAEERLWQKKVQLQSAFAELVKQTGGDEDHALDAGMIELDEVKARIARLESGAPLAGITRQPLPPTSAPPPDPPPFAQQPGSSKPIDVEMRGDSPDPNVALPRGQPVKFKDALRDIMKRLTAVEESKAEMDEKCDDLENLIWSQAEERVDKIMFWGQLEQNRIRQRKRRRSELEGGDANLETGDAESIAGPSRSPGTAPIDTVNRDSLVHLDGQREGKGKASESGQEGPAAAVSVTDTETVAQMRTMQEEIKTLKEALQEIKTMSITRDRSIVQAAVQGMRSEYNDIVKKVSFLFSTSQLSILKF